jgi:hypothetical protein
VNKERAAAAPAAPAPRSHRLRRRRQRQQRHRSHSAAAPAAPAPRSLTLLHNCRCLCAEFDYTPGGRRLSEAVADNKSLRAVVRALGGAAPAGALGATRLQASFSFGLDTLTWSAQFVFGATQEVTLAKIVLDLLAFIRNAVAAAKTTDPEFLEVSQVDTRKLADVKGLILTAIIAQSASLIALALAAWKLPVWFSAHLPAFSSVSAVFAAFMQFCGIVTFASSGLEKAFCDALDPTPDVSKLPCGMGYGYSAGAAAIFFSMLWAVACYRWVPWGDAGEELLGGSGSGAGPSKAADAGDDDAAAAPAAVTSMSGGYQSV